MWGSQRCGVTVTLTDIIPLFMTVSEPVHITEVHSSQLEIDKNKMALYGVEGIPFCI